MVYVYGWGGGLTCVIAAMPDLSCGHLPACCADPWLSAVGVLANTDLVASGSGDGVLKLWCAALSRANPTFDSGDSAEQMGLTSVNEIPLVRVTAASPCIAVVVVAAVVAVAVVVAVAPGCCCCYSIVMCNACCSCYRRLAS